VRKKKLNRFPGGEKGQALIIVVLLMLISALVITPMLSHVGSGLKTEKEVYEEKMQLFYAADSGIEDGFWQIDNEKLETLFTGYDKYAYYDYSHSYEWTYNLPSTVNNKDVNVALRNIWIPKDIAAPSPSSAKDIIESVGVPKLVISGSISAASTYQIKIAYYYDEGKDPGGVGLKVNTVGIWLPPGFDYAANCSLEGESYYHNPTNESYCSGRAVVWNFGSVPLVNFPGSGGASGSIERSFTFQFSGPVNVNPGAALSWIDTSGADGVSYAWDADVKVYKVTSTATDDSFDPVKQTVVEAYTAKSEIREMGTSISGDYCAVGNTLLEATGSGMDAYYRNRLYKESSATVQEFTGTGDVPPGYVPDDAHVDAAYLYWSGWIGGNGGVVVVWSDSCGSFTNNWNPGSHWTVSSGQFQGQGGGSDTSRTLSMYIANNPPTYNLDLSHYSGQQVTISWEQSANSNVDSTDVFYYAFSGDGGLHWSSNIEAFHGRNPSSTFSATIPSQYVTSQFRMRFYVGFDNTNEYVYIDNITITAPAVLSLQTLADAEVNQVMFGTSGSMTQITAPLDDEHCKFAASDDAAPGAWCYSCFYDATDMINQFIDDGDVGSSGAGTYTLGHAGTGATGAYQLYPTGKTDYPLGTPAVKTGGSFGSYPMQYQWSYAGWSLIVIYSSPATEGHQLYLFPEFRYVKVHTTMEFPISGFLVPAPIPGEEYAAHITCFVGDGDEQYPGDYIALKDQGGAEHKLSDGITIPSMRAPSGRMFSNPYDNVWNSQSVGLSANGIDIDTFQVSWSSGVLQEGDSSADVVLGNASPDPNDAELIMVAYIIVSFRSSITSGGTLSYLVRG
jgi:hypothetical protein